ncbi:MAG: YceI family protein [Verrucomicrobiales bacterium]
MKLSTKFFTAPLTALFLMASVAVQAEPVRYEARPGSKMKLDGTSTVHDWTVETKIIGGYIEFKSDAPLSNDQSADQLKVAPAVEVNIPVKSLKSGKQLMDDVMHDAMKVKDHPKIAYQLKEMTPKADRKAGDPLVFNAKGDLTVAGVTKPVNMDVTLVPEGDKLKAVGTAKIKMTDFGIKPPAPAVGLGLIKTGDDVTISFEWVTAKAAKKTASN